MELLFTSLHHIDHFTDQINKISITTQSQDLKTYSDRLINEIISSDNKRSFNFKSDTTEVRTAISKFLELNYEEGIDINSKRLLNIEKDTQKKMAHLVRIQKGSLFQAVLGEGQFKFVIISKADHNQFLDEVDFTLKNGLPWEKRIFKAFLVKFDGSSPTDIFVYDTSSVMSKYWWDGYLELEEVFTDTHNTKTALDILDKKIFNRIRNDYPADHTLLRNNTLVYFRSHDEFELNAYVESTFNNYVPVDPKFPKEKTITNVRELPQKWGFDSRFGIVKEEIKKRQVNKIPLTEEIDLILKGPIKNIDSVITSEIDKEGNKYIMIKTAQGYERFKKRNT
jgi:hypothetical protein